MNLDIIRIVAYHRPVRGGGGEKSSQINKVISVLSLTVDQYIREWWSITHVIQQVNNDIIHIESIQDNLSIL